MAEKTGKLYTVIKQFTDSRGKVWKPDDEFPTTDQKAVSEALAQGAIEEDEEGQEGQAQPTGQQTGQAPKR